MKLYSKKCKANILGTSGGVMVSKQAKQTSTREFGLHSWPYSYGLVLHLSKNLSKLLKKKNHSVTNEVSFDT